MTILRLTGYHDGAAFRVNTDWMAEWEEYGSKADAGTLITIAYRHVTGVRQLAVKETLTEIDAAMVGMVKTVDKFHPAEGGKR